MRERDGGGVEEREARYNLFPLCKRERDRERSPSLSSLGERETWWPIVGCHITCTLKIILKIKNIFSNKKSFGVILTSKNFQKIPKI